MSTYKAYKDELLRQVSGLYPVRPELGMFSYGMEASLKQHDEVKGSQGWKTGSISRLTELAARKANDINFSNSRHEQCLNARDLGNYAMMLHDLCMSEWEHDSRQESHTHSETETASRASRNFQDAVEGQEMASNETESEKQETEKDPVKMEVDYGDLQQLYAFASCVNSHSNLQFNKKYVEKLIDDTVNLLAVTSHFTDNDPLCTCGGPESLEFKNIFGNLMVHFLSLAALLGINPRDLFKTGVLDVKKNVKEDQEYHKDLAKVKEKGSFAIILEV